GTFKDRLILERDPHALIEGIIICCYAVGIKTAYIYIRGEYDFPLARLSAALDEAYREGYVGKNIKGSGVDVDIVIHRGAGAYICGDETGLIESLEGKKGQPRPPAPKPAVSRHHRRVQLPHRRQQRGDHFGAVVDHESRRRLLRRHRHGEEQGHDAVLDLRYGRAPRRV